jgi:hypothetical protein
MAKTLNQIVTQINGISPTLPERIIVQFTDDVDGDEQTILNYDDMTTEEKAIYDTFKQMCEVIMNNS